MDGLTEEEGEKLLLELMYEEDAVKHEAEEQKIIAEIAHYLFGV